MPNIQGKWPKKIILINLTCEDRPEKLTKVDWLNNQSDRLGKLSIHELFISNMHSKGDRYLTFSLFIIFLLTV